MIRSLAPLVGLAVSLLVAACQEPTSEPASAPEAVDPVIADPDLTMPPEEAEAPPPVGAAGSAPLAPETGTPTLPSAENAIPSAADSPPAPDA